MPHAKSHDGEGAHYATHTCNCNWGNSLPRMLCVCRFSMAANGSDDWLLTACMNLFVFALCPLFILMVTGFVFFPLIVVTAPAYACAVSS